jgi:hypothetical protein
MNVINGGGIGVVLGWYWGGIGVVLGWYWGGIGVVLNLISGLYLNLRYSPPCSNYLMVSTYIIALGSTFAVLESAC